MRSQSTMRHHNYGNVLEENPTYIKLLNDHLGQLTGVSRIVRAQDANINLLGEKKLIGSGTRRVH